MIAKRAARAAGETRKTGLSVAKTAATAQAGPRLGKRARLGRWAGVILAVGAAGGCGLLHQAAAPAGMEKQIHEGEQVSAASQAHASPAARSAGTGTSAAGRGSVGIGPAAATVPTPSAIPGKIRGKQVTAIGDSVMAASAATLESVIPGIYVDAKIDREMQDGVAIVRSLAASGQLRPVVVVGLGTNWKGQPGPAQGTAAADRPAPQAGAGQHLAAG